MGPVFAVCAPRSALVLESASNRASSRRGGQPLGIRRRRPVGSIGAGRQRLQPPKKLRPALGGELAARDPVWDGEGWGCDRVACLRCLWLSVIAGAGGGDCGAAVAKRDPYIRIALRLTLDEAVSSLGPGHDGFVLVV